MIKLLPLFLSLLLTLSGVSQEHELLKAEIKAKSKLNKTSASKGFEFVAITARFGKGMENLTKVSEAISDIRFSGDTLLVEASLVANCCVSFVAELEVIDNRTLNFVFEKNDIDCLCLKGIYLTYKIIAPKGEYAFQMNGTNIELRKVDPNAEREEMEFWDSGNMKSIKMYKGEKLHTEHQYNEAGKRIKTLFYKDGKVTEKLY
ncbi:MAG: hypothetical protein JKY42_12450 [Flavobacteriales bacterium]|nr:hypothetical protein [Flavobacteriales bacterium]